MGAKIQTFFFFFLKKAGIKSDYGTRIKNNFQAEPFQYDFQGDSNKAVNIVNNKVSRASNGGLKKFLDPSKYPKNYIKCTVFENQQKKSHSTLRAKRAPFTF